MNPSWEISFWEKLAPKQAERLRHRRLFLWGQPAGGIAIGLALGHVPVAEPRRRLVALP
jgi:hypothetical protein